jgi:hypothetical protein
MIKRKKKKRKKKEKGASVDFSIFYAPKLVFFNSIGYLAFGA